MIATSDSTAHLQQASKTRLYRCWQNMRARCTYKSKHNYGNYGGRGIRVCDSWQVSFREFFSWALSSGYGDSLTLDRIDPNGNYEPSNCRWLTRRQQSANVSKSKHPRTSIYKGVCRVVLKSGETHWRAQIKCQGAMKTIGTYTTEREAGIAYDTEARKLLGEFARLNFPA